MDSGLLTALLCLSLWRCGRFVQEEVTALPLVQGAAVDYLDQGGGLCMKDVLAPTMQHLQSVLDRLLEQQKGGGLSSPMAMPVLSAPSVTSPVGEMRPSAVSPVVVPTLPIGSPVAVQGGPVLQPDVGSTTTSLLDFF